MSKFAWIWALSGAIAVLVVLFFLGDVAYREFYIKPIGVAFLVEQFPEIVSSEDPVSASPEMMILSPAAFEPDCAEWIWGCYSVEAYRRVAQVYVMRQHGGLNEVIPCDPAGCPDGRDYRVLELSSEESKAVGRTSDARSDIVDVCSGKVVGIYEMRACRHQFTFDDKVVSSNYVLQITSPIFLRFIVDWPSGNEIVYTLNRVSGNKYFEGGSDEILKEYM